MDKCLTVVILLFKKKGLIFPGKEMEVLSMMVPDLDTILLSTVNSRQLVLYENRHFDELIHSSLAQITISDHH